MQQAMMDWQSLRQSKGQSLQEYTQEFRKRALVLGIPLYTQETLLNYIRGLHSYLCHMILMFNLTNLNEVCFQVTRMESKEKNTIDFFSMKPFKPYGNKFKGKGKGKHTTTMKNQGEKPMCTHFQEKGHDASKCWKLHIEFKPEKFQNKEDKKTTTIAIQHDFGSDFGDETKFVATSIQGKNPSIYISKHEPIVDERREVIYFI